MGPADNWYGFASGQSAPCKGLALILLLLAGAIGAVWDQAWYSAALLLLIAALPACRMLQECAGAMATVQHALKQARIEDV